MAVRTQVDALDARRPAEAEHPELERFQVLVAASQSARGEERSALARAIVDRLIAMRAPNNDQAEARAILKVLDLKALDDLYDLEFRDARVEAVRTLLHFGFPLALQVPPDDLAYALERPPASFEAGPEAAELPAWKRQMRRSRAACLWLVAAASGLQVIAVMAMREVGLGQLLLAVALGLVSIVAASNLYHRADDPDTQTTPLAALALAAIAAGLVAMVGALGAFAIGAVGNGLGLAAALGWQKQDDGDIS